MKKSRPRSLLFFCTLPVTGLRGSGCRISTGSYRIAGNEPDCFRLSLTGRPFPAAGLRSIISGRGLADKASQNNSGRSIVTVYRYRQFRQSTGRRASAGSRAASTAEPINGTRIRIGEQKGHGTRIRIGGWKNVTCLLAKMSLFDCAARSDKPRKRVRTKIPVGRFRD